MGSRTTRNPTDSRGNTGERGNVTNVEGSHRGSIVGTQYLRQFETSSDLLRMKGPQYNDIHEGFIAWEDSGQEKHTIEVEAHATSHLMYVQCALYKKKQRWWHHRVWPCALSGTAGQRSERKAAQPKNKRQKGQSADCGNSSGFFFEEVVVEESPETRRCILPVVPNP